jgi:hypothetical protein
MKNKLFTLIVCFVFAFTACKNTNTQNKENDSTSTENTNETASNDEEAPELSSEEMNKIYADYMSPSEMHKWMATMAGEWEVQTVSFMGEKPDTTMGTISEKMIVNGMYKESDYSGTMMGMPFMGKSIMGFDNAKKEFISTWVDNFGSGMLMSTGTYDEATKTLTMTGEFYEPVKKEGVMWKQVTTFIDENNYKVEMYSNQTGKEEKALEQHMTRKTGA